MDPDDRTDNGDGDGNDAVTRAEMDNLVHRFDELHEAMNELREAKTSREKTEARADVEDREDALERAAHDLGISAAQIREAAKRAKDEEAYGAFKRYLERHEAERAAAAVDADKDKSKPKPPSKKPTTKLEPDTEPVKEHWSEIPLKKLLK